MKANFVDLMFKYPRQKNRLAERINPTEEDKLIAKKFDWDYFDGNRKHGYGGFNYDPKFWTQTIKLFIDRYKLNETSSILDVGCGKGFMLVDILKAIPEANITGLDISKYSINNSHKMVKNKLIVGNCSDLPFKDSSFDLVISINTIHNLSRKNCIKAITEIERVKKKYSYIVVDGWDTMDEEKALKSWVLTAETLLSSKSWTNLFSQAGYTGDFSFWKVH